MSRYFEMNKGWKIFGKIAIVIALVIGVYCAICGIVSAIQQVPFAESFTTFFGLIKGATENVPADEVVETANILIA